MMRNVRYNISTGMFSGQVLDLDGVFGTSHPEYGTPGLTAAMQAIAVVANHRSDFHSAMQYIPKAAQIKAEIKTFILKKLGGGNALEMSVVELLDGIGKEANIRALSAAAYKDVMTLL